jgi:tight adherence protein B
MRSGANLTRGLEQLASWQPAPLRQEFSQVLSEYQIGRDLGESLENLHRRINKPEVELTTGAINISRQVGGNLADTLESLAETLAEKITIEGKIKALTAMGRMQGWVVTAVPLFMGLAMYLTNPEQIMPLFTESGGWVILIVISIMMMLAVFTIRKIVNIDV